MITYIEKHEKGTPLHHYNFFQAITHAFQNMLNVKNGLLKNN